MSALAHTGGAPFRRALSPAFAAVALCAAGALTLAPSPASASSSQITIFDPAREFNGEFGDAIRDETFGELEALGVDVVRMFVSWPEIAPGADETEVPPGFVPRDHLSYGVNGSRWAKIDAVVAGAAAHGMDVLLTPTGRPPTGVVPLWASNDPTGSRSDPDAEKFGDFAYALGRRYGGGPGSVGDVGLISPWNEPNNRFWLRAATRAGAAKLYRRLFVAAARGLDEAGWNGRLLIGETGPNPPGKRLDPVPFLRGVLCLDKRYRRHCAALPADGWAHHPYALRFRPGAPTFDPGHVEIGSLGRLTYAIKRASLAGALRRGTKLYITEFGYQTLPDPHFGVSLKQQAAYLSRSELIAYRDKRVASFAQYLLRDDDPAGGTYSGFESGLRVHDSAPGPCGAPGTRCKPAYAAFRTPLAVVLAGRGKCIRRRGGRCVKRRAPRRASLWGHVRPGGGPSQVVIRFRDRGGRVRRARIVSTDARGYFRAHVRNRPGRRWSARWNGFNGPFVAAGRI